MAEQPKLSGPDLALGLPVTTLAPGEKLLGHVGTDPVLLARLGDDYVAIGATCTHYGGPLAEGVIAGDSVRCPWHHACFDLRTGEARHAPALSPVPTWEVERRGEQLVVTAKRERDPLAILRAAPSPSGRIPQQIVIVGAGAAGSAAAEMLRRLGFDGRVLVIDPDRAAPYDRPNLSKDYLAGTAPEEWIPLRPPGFYAEHRIELVPASVTRIDVAAKRVTLDHGEDVAYDALLLAPGAEPVRLQLPGAELPHVHYLRSLSDSRAIIAAAERSQGAVVIGGSFIGLETAAALRTRGIPVRLVAPETLPLERILGSELGEFVKGLHEAKGVEFHLGHKPARIDPGAVVLDDGTRLEADLVVIGVGVRPRLALAESAGLALDRGVVVNARLETSVPGIYAAGDLARWPDPHSGESIRVEHWVVAQRMGQAAAANLLGADAPFAAVPFFWSAHYDVSINYVGHAERWDNVRVAGSAAQRDLSMRFERNGKLLALATVFRDRESLETELALERASA